jgi:hypothetical protein
LEKLAANRGFPGLWRVTQRHLEEEKSAFMFSYMKKTFIVVEF